MSRLSDASSRRFLIPLAGFGEPTQDYLLAAASAGLPPVAAVKALLDEGLRRGAGAKDDPRDGGRSCSRCGGAGGAGAARGEDRAADSGGGGEGASGRQGGASGRQGGASGRQGGASGQGPGVREMN